MASLLTPKNLEKGLESKFLLNIEVSAIIPYYLFAKIANSFVFSEEKMSSARGNNKEEAIRYEQRRLATIAGNKRKLDALKLPSLSNVVQHDQTKKRKKVLYTYFLLQ